MPKQAIGKSLACFSNAYSVIYCGQHSHQMRPRSIA